MAREREESGDRMDRESERIDRKFVLGLQEQVSERGKMHPHRTTLATNDPET